MAGPARKLKKSAVKNIVRFPPVKSNGGKSILVESILESQYGLHLEFNSEVSSYDPQPETFRVPLENGELVTYTPDFRVRYLSGAVIFVEVKPTDRTDEDYRILFARFEQMLRPFNVGFELVDESVILLQPRLSNYELLYQFRKRPSLDMANLYGCSKTLKGAAPLSYVVQKLKGLATLREIYTWIAMGYLDFDMDAEKLTLATKVTFHVG